MPLPLLAMPRGDPSPALMTPLTSALQVAIDKIQVCKTCGNIDTQNPCTVCTAPRRDPAIIVVVADVELVEQVSE